MVKVGRSDWVLGSILKVKSTGFATCLLWDVRGRGESRKDEVAIN